MPMARSIIALLPLLACGASVAPRANGELAREEMLRYRLEAIESTAAAGGPVRIRFTLENVSSQPLWVLTWYTPLEGINGEIFGVTRDGRSLPYEGRMVKRGPAQPEEYVHIEAGGVASREVDLSTSYDLSQPGSYRVEFVGRVHDVLRTAVTSARAQDEHASTEIEGSTASFRLE